MHQLLLNFTSTWSTLSRKSLFIYTITSSDRYLTNSVIPCLYVDTITLFDIFLGVYCVGLQFSVNSIKVELVQLHHYLVLHIINSVTFSLCVDTITLFQIFLSVSNGEGFASVTHQIYFNPVNSLNLYSI